MKKTKKMITKIKKEKEEKEEFSLKFWIKKKREQKKKVAIIEFKPLSCKKTVPDTPDLLTLSFSKHLKI